MYLVICYAVHDKEVTSVDTFSEYDKAKEFLMKNAHETYNETRESSIFDSDPDEVKLKIIDNKATVTDANTDCMWTWDICLVPV